MNDSDDYTVEGVVGWGEAFSGQAGEAIWRRSAWRPHALRGSRRMASWRTGAFMGQGSSRWRWRLWRLQPFFSEAG
ncbi:MAG: hypothetical protein PHD58_09365 [Anaerolineales bacterium]|nr:hypothetical protein [Anaerolineales bacterium]